jgi:uncharacterized protein (TIGR03067 family)
MRFCYHIGRSWNAKNLKGIVIACLILAIACCSPVLIFVVAFEDRESDLAKLQGSWAVETEKATDEAGRLNAVYDDLFSHVFDKNMLILMKWNNQRAFPAAPFWIRPDEQPKQIDIRFGNVWLHGIYELNADQLKLCYSTCERPRNFDIERKKSYWLVILRRSKANNSHGQ